MIWLALPLSSSAPAIRGSQCHRTYVHAYYTCWLFYLKLTKPSNCFYPYLEKTNTPALSLRPYFGIAHMLVMPNLPTTWLSVPWALVCIQELFFLLICVFMIPVSSLKFCTWTQLTHSATFHFQMSVYMASHTYHTYMIQRKCVHFIKRERSGSPQ